MLKDTGNSLGVKSLEREGNSSLSKEEGPQTKSRLLLRPVISSYRTSDCPGPVTGKKHQELPATERGGCPVLSRGAGELLPASLRQPQIPSLLRGTEDGGAGTRAGSSGSAAARSRHRKAWPRRKSSETKDARGWPNHWATEFLELEEDSLRHQQV